MSVESNPEFLAPPPSNTLETIFRERFHEWMEFFDNATILEANQVGIEAVRELDRYWSAMGIMNKKCLVSGVGNYSTIESKGDEEGIPQLTWDTGGGDIEGITATSKGFIVLVDTNTMKPELWHLFEDELELKVSSTYRQKHITSVYIKASTASIAPLESSATEESEPPLPEEDITAALFSGAETFDTFMKSEHFRSLPNTKKGAQIDDFLSKIESKTRIRSKIIDFMAERVVKIYPNTDEGRTEYDVLNLHDICLTGKPLGLSMFHRELIANLPTHQSLTRPQRTGYLGLIVELIAPDNEDNETSEGLRTGTIVHVPLTDQHLSLQFAPASN